EEDLDRDVATVGGASAKDGAHAAAAELAQDLVRAEHHTPECSRSASLEPVSGPTGRSVVRNRGRGCDVGRQKIGTALGVVASYRVTRLATFVGVGVSSSLDGAEGEENAVSRTMLVALPAVSTATSAVFSTTQQPEREAARREITRIRRIGNPPRPHQRT